MATTKSTKTATKSSRYTELKAMLENRRNELTSEVHGKMRDVRAEGGKERDVLDQGESSEIDIQEDIELALIQMKAETLNKINEALRRLDEGTYGNCFECGDEIAEARLRAFAAELEGPRRQLLSAGGAAAKVAGNLLDALSRMLAASPLNEHRRRFLQSLRPGDPVKLIKMNEVGRVKRVLKKSDRVEVEVRRLSVTVGIDEIAPAPRGE